MNTRAKICIVTTRHVSYNPRVVKEADALTEAGYDVTVVAARNHPELHRLDLDLMASRCWKLASVNYRPDSPKESLKWFVTGCRKKAFEGAWSRLGFGCGVAERALGRTHTELARLACGRPADLYIAHHVDALGAAWQAARRFNALFAFDAEDFHSGELPNGADPHETKLIEYLERKYLPRCAYVTASSEDIAGALGRKYTIRKPETILNVFPLERLAEGRRESDARVLSCYWYSQVIGPGRGLEEVVQAVVLLHKPCELHLRGTIHDGFDDTLATLARRAGGTCRIHFHKPSPPERLVQLAAKHDVGLAVEIGDSMNRLLCVPNKLFVYMLAGLAVLATDTPGQRRVMGQHPEAGLLCHTKPSSMAAALDLFLSDTNQLAAAKSASKRAAEKEFNWDFEKQKLLRLVERTLAAARKE